MRSDEQHILMSVSKSMTGLLAGVLIGEGKLDADGLVTDYIPATKGSGFEGATVRHLLDMRTGIEFDEDYLATGGAIIQYREATGWNPPLNPGDNSDLHSFLPTLPANRPHGGNFSIRLAEQRSFDVDRRKSAASHTQNCSAKIPATHGR